MSSVQCDQCQNPASHSYKLADNTLELCEQCFYRHKVQDAYEQQLPEIESLMISGQYEDIVKKLQVIYDNYHQYDHDGWLQNSILSHQALILVEQGKFEDALESYRTLARKEFDNPIEWLVNQLAIARVFNFMGMAHEAISELEIGLDAAKDSALPTVLSLFDLYAQIAEKQEWPVSLKYAPLLRKVIQWWGLPVANEYLDDSISLTSAIKKANAENKEAQVRYESLHKKLAGVEGRRQRTELIEKYIVTEVVVFYQDMAKKLL